MLRKIASCITRRPTAAPQQSENAAAVSSISKQTVGGTLLEGLDRRESESEGEVCGPSQRLTNRVLMVMHCKGAQILAFHLASPLLLSAVKIQVAPRPDMHRKHSHGYPLYLSHAEPHFVL